jgi:hypothetical protein
MNKDSGMFVYSVATLHTVFKYPIGVGTRAN